VSLSHDGELSERTIAAAIAVHRTLGPGLLESIFERALLIELRMIGLTARSQVDMPLEYRGQPLGIGLRLALLIDERLIAEIKSVSRLDDLHFRQLTTYLRIARLKTGLLINFNVTRLVQGIRRVSL
jgi:GxxExxY protein